MTPRAADDHAAIRARSALVLFSGGQDSTTCLAWALDRFDRVETVGFNYGQRHRAELWVRPVILNRLRDEFPEWRDKIGLDKLLHVNVQTSNETFVPGRNILFIIYAAALVYRSDVRDIVIGACGSDSFGFPDCRDDAIKAVQIAINLGMQSKFVLHAPLMCINKTETWKLAKTLGGLRLVELIRDETHTCYENDHEHQHSWGYGCGECAACQRRAEGYQGYAV